MHKLHERLNINSKHASGEQMRKSNRFNHWVVHQFSKVKLFGMHIHSAKA